MTDAQFLMLIACIFAARGVGKIAGTILGLMVTLIVLFGGILK